VRPLISAHPRVRELYYEDGFDVFELYDSGFISEALPGSGAE
jgi:hypothetical protein